MANARIPVINIEGAQLRFKNFSGKGDKFNPEGTRNFCVLIDPARVPELINQGWNIKYLKPKEEGLEPVPYLKVNVAFANVPPNIYHVTKKQNGTNSTFRIGEEAVGSLDFADIENVDLTITPYHYNFAGRTGVSAYLKTMYVTITPDAFAEKYANPNEEGDLPPF